MNPLRVLWLAAVAIALGVIVFPWMRELAWLAVRVFVVTAAVFVGVDAGQRWYERSRDRHLDEIRDRDRTVRTRRHGRPGERAVRQYTRTRQEW